MLRSVKFITMDLFETCICIKPSLPYHYLRISKKYGLDLQEERVAENFRSVYSKFKRDYSPLYYNPRTTKDWWYGVAYQTIFLSIAGDTDTTVIDRISIELFEEFKTTRCWCVYPDAIQFLDYCMNRGIPVAGLSNFDNRLSPLLFDIQLSKYFLFVLSLANKPDTKCFKLALDRAGCEPADSCHVGDSIRQDCVPALSLGIKPVFINRRESTMDIVTHLRESGVNERDVIVVNSLSELERYFSV